MSELPLLRNEWDGVLEVVLNRPDKLNSINIEMMELLGKAVRDFRDESRHKVLLIRGVGRYFCAGADVSEPLDYEFDGSPARVRLYVRKKLKTGMANLWQELERIEKPSVVAHHAPCVGGGLELSLSCDFRLAAKSAHYSLPEIEFGMLPLSGGLSRLTRVCGPHWAKWMILANRKITAERALIAGLVHDVIPDETFEEEAKQFARELAARPSEALAIGKTAIDLCAETATDDARAVERLVYASLQFSDEYKTLYAERQARHRK